MYLSTPRVYFCLRRISSPTNSGDVQMVYYSTKSVFTKPNDTKCVVKCTFLWMPAYVSSVTQYTLWLMAACILLINKIRSIKHAIQFRPWSWNCTVGTAWGYSHGVIWLVLLSSKRVCDNKTVCTAVCYTVCSIDCKYYTTLFTRFDRLSGRKIHQLDGSNGTFPVQLH